MQNAKDGSRVMRFAELDGRVALSITRVGKWPDSFEDLLFVAGGFSAEIKVPS